MMKVIICVITLAVLVGFGGAEIRCTTHDNCDVYGPFMCQSSYCVNGIPVHPLKHCTEHKHCAEDKYEGCIGGYCMKPLGFDTRSTCGDHKQCPKNTVCHEGRCTIAEPTHTSCSTECSDGQACWDNLCWKVSEGIGSCTSHAQCPGFFICQDKQCHPSVPAQGCDTDRDCSSRGVCKRNKCWKELMYV